MSARLDLKRLDQVVRALEQELAVNPSNVQAASKLYAILDYYVPGDAVSGFYTDCQKALADQTFTRNDIVHWVKSGSLFERCKDWLDLLSEYELNKEVAVVQLPRGKVHRIKGVNALCEDRLKLFDQTDVISKLCMSCFKVQVVPSNVSELIELHFLFKVLEFPKDNARKCMIELREKVPSPYKGYILCESEADALHCLDVFNGLTSDLGLTPFNCKITRGCSEFGMKYPDFKYSPNGAHNQFERPGDWTLKEAEFFLDNPKTNAIYREAVTNNFVTLQEILLLRTWVDYANIIGDEAGLAFGEPLTRRLNRPFVARIEQQSALRKTQLDELQRQAIPPE